RSALLAMLSNIPPPLLGVELPAVVVALEPADIEKASVNSLIAALPAPSIDKIWVKVRQPISVEELSSSLRLDKYLIAKLNDVNVEHHFRQGDWLVVPSQQSRQIKQLAAIDSSELRRTPPLQSLPPVEERAVVRFGDTVVKIAQRYGLSLQELLRLNPGLETARLVVGSQVRLAQASSTHTRMVLGLKPTTSGGISWPELPGFDKPPSRSPVSWPTTKPLSPNEQAVLQRIRSNSYTPQWRTYGQCKYDWGGWRLNSNGTRTTAAECGGSAMRWTVGVSCDRLLVAGYTTASGWSKWRAPAGPGNHSRQGEDEMVAALCANV
ncbi:LysM peptidoglycan-binding domain-containing protein, partial [Cyanobium sp. A2C-AMD]|uniref:lytic transglycosylase n=1 Tax=Cyanobium sp. A2C-AMD TaxID=2823695 RepID=UPI0028F447C7